MRFQFQLHVCSIVCFEHAYLGVCLKHVCLTQASVLHIPSYLFPSLIFPSFIYFPPSSISKDGHMPLRILFSSRPPEWSFKECMYLLFIVKRNYIYCFIDNILFWEKILCIAHRIYYVYICYMLIFNISHALCIKSCL